MNIQQFIEYTHTVIKTLATSENHDVLLFPVLLLELNWQIENIMSENYSTYPEEKLKEIYLKNTNNPIETGKFSREFTYSATQLLLEHQNSELLNGILPVGISNPIFDIEKFGEPHE